jgi:hypothetical protein
VAKIQLLDQSKGNRLIIPLGPEALRLSRCSAIAHMVGCDTERMSFPGTLAAESFSAPQEPAVKPIEATVRNALARGARVSLYKCGSHLRSIKGAFIERRDSYCVIGVARGMTIQTAVLAATPKLTSLVT